MSLTRSVPVVAACAMHECAYNCDDLCRAEAITVGDGLIPRCDTMVLKRTTSVSLDQSVLTGVSSCKVNTCAINHGLSCGAEHIAVGLVADSARCLTYTRQ